MVVKISKNNNTASLSYWELKNYFKTFDLIVVGSGIVGLNAALAYKKINKNAEILILEKGFLASGGSTKNAGFSCFGSVSELLSDLSKIPEKRVWETVKMRWEGLKLLRSIVGDKNMRYQELGGFEIFDSQSNFETCSDQLNFLNKQLHSLIGKKNTYSVASDKIKNFRLKNISGMLLNKYEGQLDTAFTMDKLTQLVHDKGIKILNNISVNKLNDIGNLAELESNFGVFKSKKVIVAINGFAKDLLKIKDVEPARAQVLITKPIKNLKLKGAFHYDEGYYYFRNIDDRVLLGGGRNLDLKGENTTEITTTPKIQNRLENLLKTMVLADTKFEIEHRWAGIMGVGNEKKPVIRHYSKNVVCAVRMGGMGVAIGSLVGKEAADLV